MADLGSIGKLYGGLNQHKIKRFPAEFWNIRSWWASSGVWISNLQTSYSSLSGIVTRQGTPVGNVWVRLYYRPNGQMIAQTKSSNDGTFSFSPSNDIPIGLNQTDTKNYYVLAIDNNNSQNTPTADLLTAV